MRRASRSFRRSSRISLACLCFVASSDELMASSERLVISRSAICATNVYSSNLIAQS